MPNQAGYSPSRSHWRAALRLAASLIAALAIGTTARAQSDSSTTPAEDPPARVGRISLLSGPVTFTDYRSNEESDASLNWPLTSQQRLTTGRVGRVEVRIGSTSVRLDGDSVLDFNRIDDEVIQLTLQRGTAAVRVRNRDHLREIDFLTPRERILFEDVGRYRIDVDRSEGISAVTVGVGSARVVTGRINFVVQSGQRGEATAEPAAQFHLVSPSPDVFDDWVAARDRRDDSLQSTRYVSAETTGVESLDEHGEWSTVESYGAVWFPTGVVSGWAPYRYGRWAYVAPWGWTWIDDASWGFTPFHYGRWIHVHNRWGWIPGAYVSRPCYSPALVAWYGSPGVSVSIGSHVGWFPLGPGEVFIPGYRHSRRYINSLNYGHVTNINYITVINPPPHYRNRQPGLSTWVPGDAIVRRQPINRVVQPAPNEWAKLPTAQRPPAKVTEEFRRARPGMVNAVSPIASPPRANDPSRINAPTRGAPARDRPLDRDAQRDVPNRPPKVAPDAGSVAAPVQRPPRLEMPRADAPRNELPRGDASTPARPPKQPLDRSATAPSGQVGTPPQQIAPRPMPAPRQDAPVQHVAPRTPAPRVEAPMQPVAPRAPAPRMEAPAQPVAPRAAPAPRQEAPVQRVAPPQRAQGAENVQRPKTAPRVESQR
jgi:hypothetical protein